MVIYRKNWKNFVAKELKLLETLITWPLIRDPSSEDGEQRTSQKKNFDKKETFINKTKVYNKHMRKGTSKLFYEINSS